MMLYSALSVKVGLQNGFDNKDRTYPDMFTCFHLTFWGFSFNFGENKSAFFDGEFGLEYKGIIAVHAGYRFLITLII
jgi:hypothetical protein